jgi:hypothetical protein
MRGVMADLPCAVKTISALGALAAESILALRWNTPSPRQWVAIDAAYAYAATHHEGICVYAVNSPLALIRGTSFDTWVHAPATLHVSAAMFVGALLTYLGARWLERETAKGAAS